MSHRESCVWHPMPDEVRRSSVQSRRASLAAGRRKQMQDEPDWEVEAPPTPPPNDYSPRQEAAEAEARAEAEAKQAEQEAEHEAEAAESREPVEEARHEPVEEKSAAEAAQEREVAEAEAAAAAGEEPAAQAAEAAEASCEEEADGRRAKTRHTIRFRGDKWATVTDEARRKAAFEEDVADAAGLTPEQLRSLKFEVEPEMMVATFYVSHPAADRQKMREVHHKFQEASFTHTCALYPE